MWEGEVRIYSIPEYLIIFLFSYVPNLSIKIASLEDVKIFSQRFDTMLYSHTKREGNFIAHSLAKYAISIPDFLVWIEDVPPHIQHFVQADLEAR